MSDKVKYPKGFGQHKVDRKRLEAVETSEETEVVALKKELKLLLTETTGEKYLIDGDQTDKLDISKAPFDMKTLKNKIYPASTLDALGVLALEYQIDKKLKILFEKIKQEQKQQEHSDYGGNMKELYREKVTEDAFRLILTAALVDSQIITHLKVADDACGINFLTQMRAQEKVRMYIEADDLRALMTDKIGDSCTDSELLQMKKMQWCLKTGEAGSYKRFAEDTNHLVYNQEKFVGNDIMNKWDNEQAQLHCQGIKDPFSVRKYMEYSEDQMILMLLKLQDQIPEIGPGEGVAKLLMMGHPVLDSYNGSCLYMALQRLFYKVCAVERIKLKELCEDRVTEYDFLKEKEELDEMVLKQYDEKHLVTSVTLQSVF